MHPEDNDNNNNPKSPPSISSSSTNEALTQPPPPPQQQQGSAKSNQPQPPQRRHAGSDTRGPIRRMFQKAKRLERQGQWRKAIELLDQILELDPTDSHSYLALAKLQARRNHWSEATQAFERGTRACPQSIHLWQAWAVHEEVHRTTTRQGRTGQDDNDNHNDDDKARQLYNRALQMDPYNTHVCHAYGLYEKRQGHLEAAETLWQRALEKSSTAALVCSLGELWIAQDRHQEAQHLYQTHVSKLASRREQVEVYLAWAWLEERYLNRNVTTARNLLQYCLDEIDPTNTWAQLALARLEGRHHMMMMTTTTTETTSNPRQVQEVTLQRLTKQSVPSPRRSRTRTASSKNATTRTSSTAAWPEGTGTTNTDTTPNDIQPQTTSSFLPLENTSNNSHSSSWNDKNRNKNPTKQSFRLNNKRSSIHYNNNNKKANSNDGRVYNAWANLQVRNRKYHKARRILQEGLRHHPRDFSLWQAAGKVEECLGNLTGARSCYGTSLCIQPSAPTLVAYALLELKHPQQQQQQAESSPLSRNRSSSSSLGNNKRVANFSQAQGLFEEALLLDPRHGPAYNSYGNALLKRGNVDEARRIFDRGVQANCSDAASVYHGYAKLELSMGNVSRGRQLLQQGLEQARWQHLGMDSPHRDRTRFLTHTLGMLELNSNNPMEARRVFADGIERHGNASSLLWLGAALSEVQLGQEDRARPLFERAVTINPRHAQAWQAWGVMEMRAGQWEEAQTLFQCGLRSNPKHGALWLAYAILEGRKGHVQVSRTLFSKGLQHAPNHTPLLQAWASLELRQGNCSAARVLITQALTRDKHNGSGWMVAAEIERRTGNTGLVLLLLRRGLECAPDSVELYRAFGDALLSVGKIQEAREIYERGMELDPQYAALYHALAELEAQVFNLEGLSKLNKRAAVHFQTNKFQPSASSNKTIHRSRKRHTNEPYSNAPSRMRRMGHHHQPRHGGTDPSLDSALDLEQEDTDNADHVLSRKLKLGHTRPRIPPEVTALAQRIVDDDDDDDGNALERVFDVDETTATTTDPDALLESLSSASIVEEGLLFSELLSSSSSSSSTTSTLSTSQDDDNTVKSDN